MFVEVCFIKFYRVCVFIYFIINVFCFNISFFKQSSDMCEIKTVLNVAALLLAGNGFCIYQINSEKNVGHKSHLKSESACEKEYRGHCLNGGERFYLIDEDIVGCNCTWLYGRKRCEKYKCRN